jgi:NAD(P)-dependent dehydrogenase (short-subunit alcohol dehydrogenase family)
MPDRNESQPLRNNVAVVTGASRGIGRAICLAFAVAGADVVIAARSTDAAPSKLPGTIESVAREVEALGRRAIAVRTDISDDASVENLERATIEAFGAADILVNNAAYLFRAPVHETPLARWDRVIDVNLRGPLICTRAFVPSMIERGRGRIINISSAAAKMVLPGMVSYSTSKAALEALTRGMAAELERFGIAVNALQVDSAVSTEGAIALNPDDDRSGWKTPEAIASCALWLAQQPRGYTGRIVVSSDVCGH